MSKLVRFIHGGNRNRKNIQLANLHVLREKKIWLNVQSKM